MDYGHLVFDCVKSILKNPPLHFLFRFQKGQGYVRVVIMGGGSCGREKKE